MFYHAAFAFGEYLFLTILLMEDIPHHLRCRKTLYKMMNSPYQTGGGILPSNCMSLTFESSNLNLTLEGKIAKKALTSRRSSWAKSLFGQFLIFCAFFCRSEGVSLYMYLKKRTTPGITKTWCNVQIFRIILFHRCHVFSFRPWCTWSQFRMDTLPKTKIDSPWQMKNDGRLNFL